MKKKKKLEKSEERFKRIIELGDNGEKFNNLEDAKIYYEYLCKNKEQYMDDACARNIDKSKSLVKLIKRCLPWIIFITSMCWAISPMIVFSVLNSIGYTLSSNILPYFFLFSTFLISGALVGFNSEKITYWLFTKKFKKTFEDKLKDLEEYIAKEEEKQKKKDEKLKKDSDYAYIKIVQNVIDIVSQINYSDQKKDLEELYNLQLRFLEVLKIKPMMRENDVLLNDPSFFSSLVKLEMKIKNLQDFNKRQSINEDAIREVLQNLQNLNNVDKSSSDDQELDENQNRGMTM